MPWPQTLETHWKTAVDYQSTTHVGTSTFRLRSIKFPRDKLFQALSRFSVQEATGSWSGFLVKDSGDEKWSLLVLKLILNPDWPSATTHPLQSWITPNLYLVSPTVWKVHEKDLIYHDSIIESAYMEHKAHMSSSSRKSSVFNLAGVVLFYLSSRPYSSKYTEGVAHIQLWRNRFKRCELMPSPNACVRARIQRCPYQHRCPYPHTQIHNLD